MDTNVNYTIVGLFIIILFTCLVFGIIWLSAGFSTENYTLYKVLMSEAVSGLSIDAPVEFNGVNVGTVKCININSKHPQWVMLLLKIKRTTPVSIGTRAKLEMRALTGISYIGLIDKGTDLRPLRPEKGQAFPLIKTMPSTFLRIDMAITQLKDSFETISKSINGLLDQENLRTFKSLLANLKKASVELTPLLKSGQSAFHLIEKNTIPKTDQAIEEFGDLSKNLSAVSSEIKQNPAVLIRGKTPRTLGPGE